jgi:hypothetical protein
MINTRALGALAAVLFLSSCAADADDDAFARQTLRALRSGDSTIRADFDPRSPLATARWELVSSIGKAGSDSLHRPVLVWRENGATTDIGRYRRLAYWVGSNPDSAVVELWLVDREGRTKINTLKSYTIRPENYK